VTIRENIFATLSSGSPTLRVYPGALPPAPVLPACVATIILSLPEEDLAGEDCNLENVHLQVDVYSKTQLEADSIAEQVRQAMLASTTFASKTTGGFDTYEPDTQLYRVMKEFSIWQTTA
jgi:Protein of unknown function (DUF3168)